MFSISLIIFFSVVLFAYWFRYSCLLILQARTKESYTLQTAGANGLRFPAVQEQLRSAAQQAGELDRLHIHLSNDYRILSLLLRCSSDMGMDPLEQRMLMLDYSVMHVWYRLMRRAAPPQARQALEEMSNIVSYFANSVGRHAAQQS